MIHTLAKKQNKPAIWRAPLALAAAAFLLAGVHAEAAAQAGVANATPVAAAAETRYAAKDIKRAFSFIDANRDARISRDEAAGFRGVAKYFDRADTNKDQVLSPEEFSQALNHKKSP